MSKFYYPVLVLILFVSAFVRLISIQTVPPHLSNDEISIAYDAYSLGRSGRDEHSHPLPITFESNGNYKAPLYAYLLVPFIRTFGQTELAARLPSLMTGLLTVAIIGFISLEVTSSKTLSLLASLVLGLTPWHIYTSRMVLETNVALFFLALGIWTFLHYYRLNHLHTAQATVTSLSLSLSIYGYHTEWVLVPVLAAIMALACFRISRQFSLALLVVLAILLVPLGIDFFAKLGPGTRANTEFLWQQADTELLLNQQPFWPFKLSLIGKSFITNYLQHISPSYLFFTGMELYKDNSPFQLGLFLWPLLIPFCLGLFRIPKNRFFVIWLILSPVVASLTKDGPHILRNLVSVLPYSVLISIGLGYLFRSHRFLFGLLIGLSFLSLVFFEMIYLVHYPIEAGETFENYKPLVQFITTHDKSYTQVEIDERFGYANQFIGVPHLFLGFYGAFAPSVLQHRRPTLDGTIFGKYKITQIHWDKKVILPDHVYVVSVGNAPPTSSRTHLEFVKDFVDPSGLKPFQIWKGL